MYNEQKDELKRKRLPFTIVENKIIKDGSVSKHALLVYVILCMFADNDSSTCFPSYNTIAQYARCSRSTAQVAVKELIEKGYVRKTAQTVKGKKEPDANLYLITGKSKRKGKEGIPSSGTPIPDSGTGCTGERYTGIPSSGKELDSLELDSLNYNSREGGKRPIYHFLLNTFKKGNPEYWKTGKRAYEAQGKAIKALEEAAQKLRPEDPLGWCKELIATFRRLKKSGDKMYQHPFKPSTLNSEGIFSHLLEAMEKKEVSAETKKIAAELWK